MKQGGERGGGAGKKLKIDSISSLLILFLKIYGFLIFVCSCNFKNQKVFTPINHIFTFTPLNRCEPAHVG